jgi:prepilin-type N-terminal cleavage/methylation domain-containing protein
MLKLRSEEGFTLIELLIVMVLMGVIGGFVTTSIVQAMQNSRATSERTIALHDIERSLQTVARELRVADPIYLTANNDYQSTIGAEVVRDRKVQVHTFTIETIDTVQFLVQDTTEYSLDALNDGDPLNDAPISLPRRRLVTDLDNGLESIFTYHGADGEELECDEAVPSQCDDLYADAAQVGIRLVRNIDGQEPIRAETRVNVRNTRYGRSTS